MEDVAEIVAGARALYGTRLLGVALFGSRVGGQPREDSDLDIAVWLEPGFTRSTSWLPWVEHFGNHNPTLDPVIAGALLNDEEVAEIERVSKALRRDREL